MNETQHRNTNRNIMKDKKHNTQNELINHAKVSENKKGPVVVVAGMVQWW